MPAILKARLLWRGVFKRAMGGISSIIADIPFLFIFQGLCRLSRVETAPFDSRMSCFPLFLVMLCPSFSLPGTCRLNRPVDKILFPALDDQDRTVRPSDDGIGNTAHDEPVETFPAV